MARVYAKMSPNQFLLLNPKFTMDGGMFKFQTECPDEFTAPEEFYDLNDICSHDSTEKLVKILDDDKKFGDMYVVVGHFTHTMNTRGYLVVIHSGVVLDELQETNDLGVVVRVHSLHLVRFENKGMKQKLSKRLRNTLDSGDLAQSGLYSMMLYRNPIIFTRPSNISIREINCSWHRLFENCEGITTGHDTSISHKRSHVMLVNDSTVDQLIASADLSPGHGPRQVKKMKCVLREVSDITYSKIEEKKKSTSDKVNLREEAISLMREAFAHKCSPEDFVAGFLAMKDKCVVDSQIAATAASVLMDAFYRIDDCKPLNEKVITKVGIDVDQVVLKCQLLFSTWGKLDRISAREHDDLNNNIKIDDKSLKQKELEFDFLRRAYEILKEPLEESANETTTYSKYQVIQSQLKKRGSSLETSGQRSEYVNLCISGVTSEVLNFSFKNKRSKKATIAQVMAASDVVIEFLLSETDFKSDYSLLQYNVTKSNWEDNSTLGDVVFVPGGLLFPFLTVLLISYLSDDHITIVVESYGGKKRGIHVHYEFEESMDTSIPKAIENLKKAEEKKIAFIIINAFRKIQHVSNNSFMARISLHLGIGCDATGGKLENGGPSFLVCSPITIDAIDEIRKGPTKNVFINSHKPNPIRSKSSDFSALTRGAVNSESDSDNSSDLDSDPIQLRHRWFAPNHYKHHQRYPFFSGLCMWETAPFTHIVKRNKKNTLGNEFLDANLSLHRIQSYSPSIRVFDGKNGIHKVGEKLFDIRKFATVTDEKNNSLVSVSDAAKKVKEWLNKARIHVGGMGKSNGMARLELTFQSKSLDFVVLEKGIDTSIRTFHQSTKVYSGSLVANFAKISLLAFEGISNALFHWFGPHSNISEPTSWDVFSEVWNYLTHVATHFFDGRRSYLTNRLYSPRLGYIFSRPFLNPSWTGINQAIISICSDDNLEKLRHIWYEKSKMMDSYKRATNTNLTSSILDLDNKFEIKLSALHHLVSANCRTNINDAVACSHCQTISSSIDSKKESWKQHPCNWNDFMNSSSTSLPRDIDIRGPLFDSYLTRVTQLLSQSQLESLTAIMGTNQNCFLTGVAGSGKSFLLKVFYPMMIRMYGFCGVSVTGPTNIAASNVCGKTIHKFFGLIADSPSEAMIYEINDGNLQKLLRNHIDNLNRLSPHVIQNVALCQVLIIDEAGMIDCATMNFVDQFFRMVKMSENPFGGVRIILIGDVLQLEPVQKKAFSNNNKAFYEHHTFKKFFVAYLRTNIRQQDDAEFLNALNKIRIGDGTAAEYLIKFVSPLNNTSKITLQMARSKKDIPLNERDRHKLDSRIKYFGLQNSRIRLKNNGSEEYNLEISNLDKRIDNAEDTGYSDLIVCHDNIERTIYTTLKNSRHELTRCYSQDRQSLYPPLEWRNETLKNMLLKLLPVLDIYVGMSCRVTYPTKSEYVCTNALVVIKGFEVVDNKVAEIHVESVEKKIKVSLIPVTISESILHHEISRTQFGLIDSAALVPWSLQCLTISDNIFYDNSRSSTTSSAVKGALYTIISRVKRKEQFSYLHSITYEEISHGVSVKGKNFDDKYRLQDCVIFNMIPFDIVY